LHFLGFLGPDFKEPFKKGIQMNVQTEPMQKFKVQSILELLYLQRVKCPEVNDSNLHVTVTYQLL
jgi:hypothetical protein